MSEFLQRIAGDIHRHRLFGRGQKILVAVSGGADSMVLLAVLHSLAEENRWKISVAHFNHQLRGRASDADEELVRKTAKRLGLKFFFGAADVKGFAGRAKLSVEMAARKLRHEFLAATARAQNISTIALAHHADDQVELFFLRLLRGTGGAGLAGMKNCSVSPADKKIRLVRPLLELPKAELMAYARPNKIGFRDDASNFSNDFLRNRVRNELLPLLREKYQPGLTGTVLRLMSITGAEAELAGELAQRWLVRPDAGFDALPVAVQRAVLLAQLTDSGVVADFELVEQLRMEQGKFVSVGPGFSAARTAAGKLELRRQMAAEFKPAEKTLRLSGRAERVKFGGVTFERSLKKQAGLPGSLARRPGTEVFDAEKVGDKIVLRHWRAGDRFQPIGLKTPVKLQDLFVNAKIPAGRRRGLVLAATSSGEIFWVEDMRIGERFKLTPGTRRRLVWRWERV